jgi:chromosome segregation ATPase
MVRRLTWIFAALAMAATAPACKRDRNDPEKTEKVIEEARDKAAEAHSDIQKQEEDLLQNQGQSARDRAAFIDSTETELADLDRRIQELRAHVQARSNDLGGEAKRDLSQDLADLEATRNEARAALDRFRAQTGPQMSQIQQVTEEALSKLRRAVKSADERMDADDDKSPTPKRTPPTPPPPAP